MVAMKKAFRRNLLREIKNSKSRFLSILIIVAIGVAFFAGVRATSPDMELTCNKYLRDNNLADLTVLSARGFGDKDIERVKNVQGVKDVIPGYVFDAMAIKENEEKPVKVHSFKIGGQEVNKPVLVEGNLPASEDECITEKNYLEKEHLKIGDWVELETSNGRKKFKISGIANSPLYIDSYERGSNSLGNGKTVAFFQIGEKSAADLSIPSMPGIDKNKTYGELSVILEGSKEKNIFIDEYKKMVDDAKQKVEDLEPETWHVLGSRDNAGINGFKNNADRIGAIGKVFPLFFFLIATLVCLTGMTRMVDEQRTQIGTFKALGYGKLAIVSEYFFYSFASSIIGSIAGALIGFKLFPSIIFNAYRIMYSLPKAIAPFNLKLAVSSALVAVSCTTLAAVLACMKELVSVPAQLMRPKAPKAGKRIFLERMGFIWKKMSFTEKVTARNILRYKKRFFMTIMGIAGCTALLLTGFGLKNSVLSVTDKQFNEIYSYNMTAYLRQPVAAGDAEAFKDTLKQYKDIESSILISQQSVSVNDNSVSNVYLMVPESKNSLKKFIHLRMNGVNINISDDGVVMTEKLSKLLKVKKGDNVEMTVDGKKAKVKVTDITEQYLGHFIYMSPECYEKALNQTVKYNGFESIIKNTGKEAEDNLSTELMKNKNIGLVDFTTSISENFKKSMKSMDSVIWVLIISAAMLAFVVMFNLTSININERIRELATIKVLGFYDKEVAEYMFRENVILSVIGTLLGLVLGLVMHRYVLVTSEIEMIMFVRAVKPLSFVYAAALTIMFAGLVNVAMYGRLKKIDMVESLKSAE